MLKRTMAVVITMLVVMAAGSAGAQCTLGVYADAAGTVNVAQGFRNGDFFHVYVVAYDEAALNAVSYSLVVPGIGSEIFIIDDPLAGIETLYGPSGNGININIGSGNNVGLGECAPGFLGRPILVADYTMVIPNFALPRQISVVANPGDSSPVVSDCTGQLFPCDVGQSLLVEGPIAAESTSFGTVKSLYSN